MEVPIAPLSWLQYGYVPTVPAYLVALCRAQDPASSSAPHGHLMKNQHRNGTISPFPAFEDLTYRPTVVSWTASLFPPELHYTCTHGCSPAPSCFSYHISKRWGGGRLGQREPHGRVSPLGKSAFQGVGHARSRPHRSATEALGTQSPFGGGLCRTPPAAPAGSAAGPGGVPRADKGPAPGGRGGVPKVAGARRGWLGPEGGGLNSARRGRSATPRRPEDRAGGEGWGEGRTGAAQLKRRARPAVSPPPPPRVLPRRRTAPWLRPGGAGWPMRGANTSFW